MSLVQRSSIESSSPAGGVSEHVPSGAAPALRVDGLVKRFGERLIVDGLSFEIRPGECYGLLGPNGAGKTTTLRALLGLTPYDGGRIELLSHPIPAAARQARMKVGVVPQMDSLDPDFTVEENLLVFGRYFGLSDAEMRRRIPDLLDFAALSAKRGARINELSGGMKRRLTLARAMVNDPDLIVLDEPTTGLDPQARHLVWERLRALLSDGKTILLTTHFMDEAERLCERLGVIDHGRMISEGAPHELIAQHLEPYVVEIYGDGLAAWLAAHRDEVAGRVEVSGETAFCYVSDPGPVVRTLFARRDVRYLQRPANLEDLFLRLTGRGMREEA
ncbi:ATP-binding cassette domain-containing protein [Verticiella sediminum]|uniref:ATP-binding cassette domain-containing protein n=1 Tax=Verticiella sediminum TaxID=1247510 RepID=A0A556AF97_9BURK|nr:ATP-binding cassette domain-containing protein [Verticiella sediminum]TSH91555.1 ATP-binding cassette domain-containing protein [Verticiella sediminum]